MYRQEKITQHLDWITVLIFAACVFLGWANIFASVYNPEEQRSIFDFSINSGKQLIWIGSSILIIIIIMVMDFKFYEYFSYLLYGLLVVALLATIIFARNIKGQTAWFELGSFRLQPSEFAKFATALALAKFLGGTHVKFSNFQTQLIAFGIIALPSFLILLQNDTGSALVFGVFVLVLYREGLSAWFLVIGLVAATVFMLALTVEKMYLLIAIALLAGVTVLLIRKKTWQKLTIVAGVAILIIGMVFSVDFVFNEVLQKHQKERILVLLDPEADKEIARGVGYNVIQSKIAIGSGGLIGKGFLQGTQTKFDFVPEQSTDFIFCTIGEEHGWIGGLVTIALFMTLLFRLVFLAERQKDKFARIYGYSVACILFFHFLVNIGMTIGLMPVIGIPLPFFSYGGSSLWSFTILLFIFLKLDAHRMQVLTRS
ncbi:MAG: rod shape-determining protein RodA [Verrucomicrobia bacterium]|nr:rod shape-determining protein RodA [Cytophagales bacterium]